MKKQGKIRAIPVTSEVIGQQVWHPRKYGIAKTKWSDERIGDGMVLIQSGLCTVTVQKANLRQLVVEYEGDEFRPQYSGDRDGFKIPVTKQIPLKYSQWQAAIDAGEVDSGKLVDFEISTRLAHDGTVIAKIIPQKKRVFTRDEVADIICAAIRSWDIEVERSRDNGGIIAIRGVGQWLDTKYPD